MTDSTTISISQNPDDKPDASQLQRSNPSREHMAGDAAYHQALEQLAATPTTLRAVIGAFPVAVLGAQPAPGEWSPREVLAHLLYVETAVLPRRIRAMLEDDDGAPMIQAPPPPLPSEAASMLEAWIRARRDNLAWLHGLSAVQLERTAMHTRYGRISVQEHVTEWAYHDLDHLRQLLETVESQLYDGMGGFRGLYRAPFGGTPRGS